MEYKSRNKFDDYGTREVEPKYSRLFLLGAKNSSEEELKEVFTRYGQVEYVSVKKDHATHAPKGFSYIKYRKASQAAEALEEMNGKTIGSDPRPIKIVIASEKTDGIKEEVKATRLFIKVPKTMEIPEIKEIFEEYGPVEHVSLVRDKPSGKPRGLAFVNYYKFSHAAQAVESADERYNAQFAEPKGSNATMKGGNPAGDAYGGMGMGGMVGMAGMGGGYAGMGAMGGGYQQSNPSVAMMNMMQTYQQTASTTCRLKVLFNPSVSKDMFWALFNIVPGLVSCDLTEMTSDGAIGSVVYNNPQSAAYAVERINGFEYPTGSRLQIRLDDTTTSYTGATSMGPASGYISGMYGNTSGSMSQNGAGSMSASKSVPSNVQTLISTIQQATEALKKSGFGDMVERGNSGGGGGGAEVDAQAYTSAKLPPRQPTLPMHTKMEERLFFNLRDMINLPDPAIITDVFCRFGNLIEALCIRGKKCGYARFASSESANGALQTLNGEDLLGSRFEVKIADEERRGKRPRID